MGKDNHFPHITWSDIALRTGETNRGVFSIANRRILDIRPFRSTAIV